MNKTIHIMLDLETWGKKPGCDLRSIGACVFDPMTAYVGEPDHAYLKAPGTFYQAVDNPVLWDHITKQVDPTDEHEWQVAGCWDATTQRYRKYPLHRDPETVAWWQDQSDEANAAFADPVDLRDGLKMFDHWLNNLGTVKVPTAPGVITIWAHGPQFDCSILAAAYDACGLPVPWHYRAPRDTRTAFDLAGIDDHSGFMGMFNTGTHHHALDDAICQAKAVCAAFRVIRGFAITGSPADAPGDRKEP